MTTRITARRELLACLVVGLAGGCAGDLDPEWQLDHDRIIAIRATPPAMHAEATSTLETLLGHAGGPATVQPPDRVEVISPPGLRGAVAGAIITAPSEVALAEIRAELGLGPGASVPLVLAVTANGFEATKTVWLGEAAANPQLADVEIGGGPPDAELVLAPGVDVPLAVTADDTTERVTWLTSCGTLHDFDLSRAYLRIEADDPHEGELVLVVRDPRGGVTWQVWPTRAESAP